MFQNLRGKINEKANELWRKVPGNESGYIRMALYLAAKYSEQGQEPRGDDAETLANAPRVLSAYLKPDEIDFILNALVKNDIDPNP